MQWPKELQLTCMHDTTRPVHTMSWQCLEFEILMLKLFVFEQMSATVVTVGQRDEAFRSSLAHRQNLKLAR